MDLSSNVVNCGVLKLRIESFSGFYSMAAEIFNSGKSYFQNHCPVKSAHYLLIYIYYYRWQYFTNIDRLCIYAIYMHMNEIHIVAHRLYNHGEIVVQDPKERDERVS